MIGGSPLRPVLPRPKPAYAPQTFSTSLKPKLFAASPVHPLPWAALPQLPLARRDFPTKKKYRLPAASPMCPIWGITSKALLSAYPWFPQAAVIPSGRSRRDPARPDGGKPHVKRSTVYRSRSMTRPAWSLLSAPATVETSTEAGMSKAKVAEAGMEEAWVSEAEAAKPWAKE